MNTNVANVTFVLAFGAISTALSIITPSQAWSQATPQQQTIFVSPQGSNNGSQSQSFRTITEAIAANPQEGVVFQLDAGT